MSELAGPVELDQKGPTWHRSACGRGLSVECPQSTEARGLSEAHQPARPHRQHGSERSTGGVPRRRRGGPAAAPRRACGEARGRGCTHGQARGPSAKAQHAYACKTTAKHHNLGNQHPRYQLTADRRFDCSSGYIRHSGTQASHLHSCCYGPLKYCNQMSLPLLPWCVRDR